MVRSSLDVSVKLTLTGIQILRLARSQGRSKMFAPGLGLGHAMTEFQKIIVGLLGMTHPEIFMQRSSAKSESIELCSGRSAKNEAVRTLRKSPVGEALDAVLTPRQASIRR